MDRADRSRAKASDVEHDAPVAFAQAFHLRCSAAMQVVGAGARVEIGVRAILIGSAETCDLVVPSAELAHVRIDDGVALAIAPCRVGKVPLHAGGRRKLLAGCAIEVGSQELWIEETEVTGVTTRDLALEAVANARGPWLVVVQGSATGCEVALDESRPFTVGRSAACDLDVGADDTVSRLHLEVTQRGKDVLVRDLGSAAGTFLGRARLEPLRPAIWTPERMVRIGNSVLGLDVPLWLRPVRERGSPPCAQAGVGQASSHGPQERRTCDELPSASAPDVRPTAAPMTALADLEVGSNVAVAPKRRPQSMLASYVVVAGVVLVIVLGVLALLFVVLA